MVIENLALDTALTDLGLSPVILEEETCGRGVQEMPFVLCCCRRLAVLLGGVFVIDFLQNADCNRLSLTLSCMNQFNI